jgi:hypothetical protein
MTKIRAGGPLIKEWPNYFLREDTEIRREAGDLFSDQIEGYSLFRVEPYGRLEVFGGSKEWAIEQAENLIEQMSAEESEQ